LNYDGAIRSFTGYATSGDRRTMIEPLALNRFEEWGKIEGPRKIIMEVLRSRLDLGWPYNYKALDLLTVMPLTELVPLADQMRALADSSAGVEGGAELKKLAKPLYEKAMGEIRKGEEDEARRKQEAITAMWGGLWANEIGRPRAGGWYGRDYQAAYPWAGMSPGVAAQAEQQWAGRPPEGWQP